jgi:Protein of unknown function (DUF2852)
MTDTASATQDGFSGDHYGHFRRGCGSRMNKKPWSIYEVGAVLGGFVIFWPLGLLALFVKMKKGELWKGAADMDAPWTHWQSAKSNFGDFNRSWKRPNETGNAAFDDYRKAAMEKLEAERRKLDEERHAFDEFLTKLRRAKDQEAFERFMAEHKSPPTTTE